MTEVCTEDDALTALLLLRETVPGDHPEISQQTAQVWLVALALYPGDVVRHTALHWTGDRFPSREEFRDAVSAAVTARREAAAGRALEDRQADACIHCGGYGWKVVSTAPLWITEPCPDGCQPPLPIYAQGRVEKRPQRRRASTGAGPARAEYGREVTDRMTGDRGDGF